MAILEQVMQLKNQGMGDQDIMNSLQQQGVPPKEIMDAINQSQIKNAVTGEAAPMAAPEAGSEALYTPQTQEMGTPTSTPETAPEYYEEGASYAPSSIGMDSDTMIELSNQVFAEKIKKTEKNIDDLNEFKSIGEVKLENMEDRLKRIEKIIDTLQIKILEKVGSYSRDLEKTKKELEMVEESFGKLGGKIKTRKTNSKKKK